MEQAEKKVTDYIEKAPVPQKEIMEAIRKLIHKSIPGTVEEFKWGQPVFRTKKDFCYLKATKNHVNLGFFNFQDLKDPNAILEGTGKQMRHVKLKTRDDIQLELFKSWFRAASA